MNLIAHLLPACVLALCAAGAAATERNDARPNDQLRKVALVIGNGAYQHASPLPNPPMTRATCAARFAS